MRKIGLILFALFALAVVLAGCAEKEKEPKKTDEEAAPTVSLLPQDAPVFSSDELFFPNTEKESVTRTSSTAAASSTPASTTTAKPTVTTATKSTASQATLPTSTSKPFEGNGGLELPEHNWN